MTSLRSLVFGKADRNLQNINSNLSDTQKQVLLDRFGFDINARGGLLATVTGLAATDNYAQLTQTWTLESGIPSGIELDDGVLQLPQNAPPGYMGLWVVLEINGAETSTVLMPWNNTDPQPNAIEIGNRYMVICDDNIGGNDRIIAYDISSGEYTAFSSARSFAFSDSNGIVDLTVGDNLLWRTNNSDDRIEAFSLSGTEDTTKRISVSGLSVGGGLAYYDGHLFFGRESGGTLRVFDASDGSTTHSSLSTNQNASVKLMTALNGVLYFMNSSNRRLYYWTINNDYSIGSSSASFVSLSADYVNVTGIGNDGRDLYLFRRNNGAFYYKLSVDSNGVPIVPTSPTAVSLTLPTTGIFASDNPQWGHILGMAFPVDSAATPEQYFPLVEADTRYCLTNSGDFIGVHYLREADGDTRLVLASQSANLPANAVVKLYAARPTLKVAA